MICGDVVDLQQMGYDSDVLDAGAVYHGGDIFQFIGSIGLDVRMGTNGFHNEINCNTNLYIDDIVTRRG